MFLRRLFCVDGGLHDSRDDGSPGEWVTTHSSMMQNEVCCTDMAVSLPMFEVVGGWLLNVSYSELTSCIHVCRRYMQNLKQWML